MKEWERKTAAQTLKTEKVRKRERKKDIKGEEERKVVVSRWREREKDRN